MTEKKYIRKEAIALSYDPQKGSGPVVTAKGKGKIAEAILAKAEEHDVPVYEDPNFLVIDYAIENLSNTELVGEVLVQNHWELFC